MRSTPKALRHHRILELVSGEPMVTQDEMVRRLSQQGLKVTQATLSRDIKELGLVKCHRLAPRPGTAAATRNAAPRLVCLHSPTSNDAGKPQTDGISSRQEGVPNRFLG